MEKINQSLEGFWGWFSEVAHELGRNLENPKILSQLDQRILAFKDGRLSWEVGAGTREENMLVISPSGDDELLLFTECLVRRAPVIPKWEFWPAKPPKQWNGTFEFRTDAGSNVFVESARWEYALLKFDDGTFDIIIKAVGLPSVAEGDALYAAGIALDGYLGEKLRLEAIRGVDIVAEFEDAIFGKTNRLPVLANHLNSATQAPPEPGVP